MTMNIGRQYLQFLRLCGRMLKVHPVPFAAFFSLTVASAVTEGVGIGLLIPLLQQGQDIGTGGHLPRFDDFLQRMLPESQSDRIAVLAAALAVVIVCRGLLQIAASTFSIYLPLRMQIRLTRDNYQAALGAGLDFFTKSDGGVLRTLVQDYPQRVAGSIRAATDIISSALLAAIYGVVMLSLSWTMTIAAIGLVGVAALGLKTAMTLPLARTGLALSLWQERWNTLLHETGLGLKLIRLLGAEKVMRASYVNVTRNYFRHDAIRQLIGEAQSPLMQTIGGLFVCGMLIYSVRWGTVLGVPQLLVLVLCLYRLTAPVTRVLTNLVIVESNLDAMQRQEAFVKTALAFSEKDGAQRFDSLKASIRFANVSFRHADATRDTLQDINLTIVRGEMIALVGPSGAGKSTMANLLGRLYDPRSGRVEIDGRDLRDYQIATWRRRIALVSQDITLFNTTVADNLTFGIDAVPREKLELAARQAAALDFINDLPLGWDTRLGDRGMRLSGGQQQRLSIARAILRDPELLIFDEATSQLDTLTEQTIQRLMDSYMRRSTIVVIAHRLSTIRRADRIAVMDAGQLVELGTHDELVAKRGRYRAMLDAQQLGLVAELDPS